MWAAAGFKDTLLRWKMKPEVVYGNETAVHARLVNDLPCGWLAQTLVRVGLNTMSAPTLSYRWRANRTSVAPGAACTSVGMISTQSS